MLNYREISCTCSSDTNAPAAYSSFRLPKFEQIDKSETLVPTIDVSAILKGKQIMSPSSPSILRETSTEHVSIPFKELSPTQSARSTNDFPKYEGSDHVGKTRSANRRRSI
jgi:hypothetical protein